jgi:hypothetical protein
LWWFTDWRMPDYTEHVSIYDYWLYPALDQNFFTVVGDYSFCYRSSTTNVEIYDYAYCFYSDWISKHQEYKTTVWWASNESVRCVR